VNVIGKLSRLKFRLRREIAHRMARRSFYMRNEEPLVSFTFDDFPRSALREGGAILRSHELTGTFFASLGQMGGVGPTGQIFSAEDLGDLVAQQHELGCHTYGHCHAWDTTAADFEASVVQNREAVRNYLPGIEWKTLSYPLSCPRPAIKHVAARYFECCRGGGQTFNSGAIDLSYLKAFFIERSRDDFGSIERTIRENVRANGWLIFVTHDISDSPTQFGCTEQLFEKIVRCVVRSGSKTLPVRAALQQIRAGSRNQTAMMPSSLEQPSGDAA
jgi:hypothetical protein